MSFQLEAIKKLFFDRPTVAKAVDAGARRGLSKFGAYTRKRAKSSLKYRAKSSAAGLPPSVHRSTGFTRKGKGGKSRPASPLRELVLFGYDPDKKAVAIGPAIGGPKSAVLRTIEEGGTSTGESFGVRKTRTYAPHPFMLPAFRAELPAAPSFFKDAIR